jgi:hypothetical protein
MARNRNVSGLSWEGRGRVVTRSRLQLELAYALYDGVVRHSRCGNRQRRDRSPGWNVHRPGKDRRGLESDQARPPGRSSPSASREHWKVLPKRRLGAFGREASGEQGVGDKAENDQTRDHKSVADATRNPQTPRTFFQVGSSRPGATVKATAGSHRSAHSRRLFSDKMYGHRHGSDPPERPDCTTKSLLPQTWLVKGQSARASLALGRGGENEQIGPQARSRWWRSMFLTRRLSTISSLQGCAYRFQTR